jgi:hypothetical protein
MSLGDTQRPKLPDYGQTEAMFVLAQPHESCGIHAPDDPQNVPVANVTLVGDELLIDVGGKDARAKCAKP